MQKKFKEGLPMINHARFLGYTKDRKGCQLVIIEEEAKIVREIFALYTGGIGPCEICRILEKKGYKTGAGKSKWHLTTIQNMLKNEKYCGEPLLQKTIGVDYLTHKRINNQNVAPMYRIENSHEAIIDKETFLLAKQIMNERSNIRIGVNIDRTKYNRRYAYSGMVLCVRCGRTMKRKQWNKGTKIVFECRNEKDGKNCDSKAIELGLIDSASLEVVNEVFLKNENIFTDIYKAVSSTLKSSDSVDAIQKVKSELQSLESKIKDLIDLKIEQKLTKEIFNKKYQELNSQVNGKNEELRKLEKSKVLIMRKVRECYNSRIYLI